MQNLKYPVKKIFLPSIDLTKIKMYKDHADGRFVLHFMDEGVSIKGQTVPAVYTDPTATAIQAGLQYLAMTKTNYGQPTSLLVDFSNAESTYNGLSLSIREKVERPGFDNSKNNHEFRTYNGYVQNPTITTGLIDAVSMETMKKQILEALEDAFMARDNFSYLTDDLYSSVYARKMVSLTGYAATSKLSVVAGKTVTLSQGTATVKYTIKGETASTSGVAWGEADTSTGVIATAAEALAMGINTSTYAYYSVTAGNIGTAVDVTFTAGTTYIMGNLGTLPNANAISSLNYLLDATKDADEFYRTKYTSPYRIANIGGVYYLMSTSDFEYFTVTGTGVTTNTLLWLRGASSYVLFEVANADAAVTVKNFQIDLLDSGGVDYLNTGTTNSDGLVNLANTLSLATFDGINFHSLGAGKYPVLTPRLLAEHFRAYNLAPTAFEAALYGNFPVVGTTYVKYEICSEGNVPNLHGASHTDGYLQRLEIYAPLSLVDDAKWDDPDTDNDWTVFKADTATSAAITFEQLLLYFSGTVLTSWK